MDAYARPIAFSANVKYLTMMQPSLKPSEVLSLIKNAKIHNRIALMLHLLPKVESYYGSLKVNKNSIFFRNWVLLHFPASKGQKVADLKLLYFYFQNRVSGNYPGFDIFNRGETGSYMVFGLLNEPGIEPLGRWNESWDLTFEPTINGGPTVEEVTREAPSTGGASRKRTREDEETSPNKRHKIEQF